MASTAAGFFSVFTRDKRKKNLLALKAPVNRFTLQCKECFQNQTVQVIYAHFAITPQTNKKKRFKVAELIVNRRTQFV